MNAFKMTSVAALCFGLCACASPKISSDARKVVLHSQLSGAVLSCKRLGVVSGEDKNLIDSENQRIQAINNLRENAAKIYAADTVVLVNVDIIGPSLGRKLVVAQGMAFDCTGR
jgi:hydroxypyruvate isomerase